MQYDDMKGGEYYHFVRFVLMNVLSLVVLVNHQSNSLQFPIENINILYKQKKKVYITLL